MSILNTLNRKLNNTRLQIFLFSTQQPVNGKKVHIEVFCREETLSAELLSWVNSQWKLGRYPGLGLIGARIKDYNENHPHSGLKCAHRASSSQLKPQRLECPVKRGQDQLWQIMI